MIHCEGAPRDLGRAQGRHHRDGIRRLLQEEGLSTRRSRWPSWRPLAFGPLLGRGPGREIIRHYPHQGERLAGIALAAGIPLASLVAKHVREMSHDLALRIETRCTTVPGESPRLVRAVPDATGTDEGWVVRRSIPEIGFKSVELTRPWFVSAFAGINEHGLAVALHAPRSPGSSTSLIATLLVQDCLQRFTTVAACADWCSKRPSQGASRLMVVDASGDRAHVAPGGGPKIQPETDPNEVPAPAPGESDLEVELDSESRTLSLITVSGASERVSFVAPCG